MYFYLHEITGEIISLPIDYLLLTFQIVYVMLISKNTESGCRIPIKGAKMKRVFVNEDKCIGCGLCRVFCQTEHSKSKDILKAYKKENPRPVSRIRLEKKGEICFSLQCRHCQEPLCVYSCLTGAMQKDSISGLVNVDNNKCMGCWTCILSCPFAALTRNIGENIVAKCDLCPDRDLPVCVANCPNEALVVIEDNVPETKQLVLSN